MFNQGIEITGYRNKDSFFGVVLLILIMYISDSPYFMYNTNPVIMQFKNVFFIVAPLLIIVRYFMKYGTSVRKNYIIVAVFLITNIFITTIVSGDSMNVGIVYGFKIIFAMFYVISSEFNDFKRMFMNIMRLIAIVSVVVYVIYQINPSIIQSLPAIDVATSDWGSTQKMVPLLFTNVYAWAHANWTIRNFGPFWEPGAFAAYLNFALFLTLFTPVNNKVSIRDILIFIIAILTTVSSGGIAATVAILFVFFVSRTDFERGKLAKTVSLIVVIISAIYLSSNNDYMSIFNDRIGNLQNGSTYSRLYSILGNIVLFFRNPLFGYGLQGVDVALLDYYSSTGGIGGIHNTNTFLLYYSSLGIVSGSIFTYMWYKISTGFRRDSFIKIFLFACMFVMFSNEDFTGSLFFLIVPMFSLKEVDQDLKI